MTKKIMVPVVIALMAVLFRLLPHPPNFTPIAAMALFGGVYFDRRIAIVVPIITLFVSDVFLGFHNTMPFVYGSFVLTGIIGLWLKNYKKAGFILGGSLFSSILFFLITNFGVWMMGTMYSKDFGGLSQAYIYAIPFFRNTVVGDILYTTVFFGGHELLQRFTGRYNLRVA